MKDWRCRPRYIESIGLALLVVARMFAVANFQDIFTGRVVWRPVGILLGVSTCTTLAVGTTMRVV